MKTKKEMIAMLLAGGQGSRLHVLTKQVAKPAVPFGGKYRIIDFPLSNCVNSGIDTVGVLTQYRPLALNSYIGNGQPWDLDRLNGGVFILPPYMGAKKGTWYKGTANAIYQNINFVERYHPTYVLVLSGDHIYKMDYAAMLNHHKKTGASATVAVLKVPHEAASRFGIVKADEEERIIDFEEKPKNPTSDLASMGIYIFNWEFLKQYLVEDENCEDSQNDFGKNILPKMLQNHEKLFIYSFHGYWKDVGTIQSLWEANMDLLNPDQHINLDSDNWRIFSRNEPQPPHFMGHDAVCTSCVVSEGCRVEGKVNHSVLFPGVSVQKGAEVSYSVIMKNTRIHPHSRIQYAIVAEDVVIEEGAVVGSADAAKDKEGIAVIGRGAVIKAGQIVPSKAMIEPFSSR